MVLFLLISLHIKADQPFAADEARYNPLSYICQRTTSQIIIDGSLDEADWAAAQWTEDFQDIQGPALPAPTFRTRVKMLWDDSYLYVAAELEEPDIWGTITQRDAVIFHDNDFEIFIDPTGDTHNYLEYEVNTLGTVWDLMLTKPYRDGGMVVNNWDIKGLKQAIVINGTLNNPGDRDEGWTLEMAIPMSVIKEVNRRHQPKEGDLWRINFSRVQWHTEIRDGQYHKKKDDQGKLLPEENWVWSPQGVIDMHRPEFWGFLSFSETAVGQPTNPFVMPADESLKWALRNIYYRQRNFMAIHKRPATLEEIEMERIQLAGRMLVPEMVSMGQQYVARIQLPGTKTWWHIRNDGFVWACNNSRQHLIQDPEKRKAVLERYEARKAQLLHERSEALLSVMDSANLQEQEALQFLYAYSTLSDLSNYDGAFFLNQVRGALAARDSFPWGQMMSEDDFLHFVLPPRAGNENMDSARQVIFHELLPRLKGMTMTEAALEVNHWCHEKVVYQGTDIRTSAPLATIKTAYGRCGEESVLTVTALRAVGIPARQIYTPRWAHQDDNHAWVEFWADGQWHYYGACEPEPDVNMGWFTEAARRAMLTATTTPGHYPSDLIVKQKSNYTRLNQTDLYADAKTLFVKVTDKDQRPMQDVSVRYLLYNYAEFYPLATLKTDRQGLSQLRLGLGDILVWAGDSRHYRFEKVSVATTDTLHLVMDEQTPANAAWDFDLVPPVAKAPLPVNETGRAANNRRLAYEDSIRTAYEATFMSEEEAIQLARKLEIDQEVFAQIIQKSRGNWRDLCNVMEQMPAEKRSLVFDLLEVISEKDLRDAPASVLLSHLQHTPSAEETAHDIWVKYVLNPRIALEKLTGYKASLRPHFPESFWLKISQNPLVAEQWINDHIKLLGADEHYIETAAVPQGTFSMKAGDAHDRHLLFVAMCRTAGVPALIDEVTGHVKFHREGIWHTVFSPYSAPGQTQAQGSLQLNYQGDEPCKYYQHFTLAKYENGFYKTLEFPYAKEISAFPSEIPLDAGEYMLVTGQRQNDGTVLSRVSFFTMAAEATTVLPVILRQRESQMEVITTFELPAFIQKMDGSKVETGQLVETYGAMAMVWLDPGKEPTRHVLRDLKNLKSTFDEALLPFLFFVPEEKRTDTFAPESYVLPAHSVFGVAPEIMPQLSDHLNRELKGELPVVILVNPKGEVLYFSSGYKIGVCEQLLSTFQQISLPTENNPGTCKIH
ncbi:hypothetical protein JCM15548_12066 [Geofilum rubicundum JCM 15548]|uniref:Transglutaminase-like domain-containing protein n=2 Tax=Geofilum TaxID=1236988 RepID=A0A0E9LW65_9BACT|nr:hypothetical protein JCM15548_12066 [Geofilum rubicundum JCM 15548]